MAATLDATIKTISKAVSDAATAGSWPATLLYDNSPDAVPADADLWARVNIIPGGRERSSVGARLHRRTGLLVFQVFSRPGIGDAAALAQAEQMERAFDDLDIGDGTLASPYIRFRAANTQTVGADGAWWQINVTAPWYTDERG